MNNNNIREINLAARYVSKIVNVKTFVVKQSHVLSIREVTIFHVRYVRADAILREHAISPKW